VTERGQEMGVAGRFGSAFAGLYVRVLTAAAARRVCAGANRSARRVRSGAAL